MHSPAHLCSSAVLVPAMSSLKRAHRVCSLAALPCKSVCATRWQRACIPLRMPCTAACCRRAATTAGCSGAGTWLQQVVQQFAQTAACSNGAFEGARAQQRAWPHCLCMACTDRCSLLHIASARTGKLAGLFGVFANFCGKLRAWAGGQCSAAAQQSASTQRQMQLGLSDQRSDGLIHHVASETGMLHAIVT